MRHKLLIPFILASLLLLASCQAEHRYGYLSEQSLATAIAHKDSAKAYLRAALQADTTGAERAARLEMLRAIVRYHCDEKPRDVSVAAMLQRRYQTSGTAELRTIAALCSAIIYASLNENDKAVRLFAQAEKIGADRMPQGVLFVLYKQWGWTLRSEKPYAEAIDRFKKAERCACLMADYTKVSQAIDLQGWEYLYANANAKALQTFDQAITIATRHTTPNIGMLLKSKASALEMTGRHEEALQVIDLAIARLHHGNRRPLMAIKGVVLTSLGRYDSARVYINRGRENDNFYQRASYLYDMSALEEAMGHYREALAYQAAYAATLDSMYNQKNDTELVKVQRLYNYSVLSAERNRYAIESQRRGIAIVAMVLLGALLIIGGTWVYHRWRQRMAERMRTREKLQRRSIAQMKERNYELLRTIQLMQEKEDGMLNNLTDKEQQIATLRQQQQQLKETIMHTDEAIRKIEQLKGMKERKKISSAKEIALSQAEMQNIIDAVNLCYDRFTDRLVDRFGHLSLEDLCLCCLLKMNTSTQDQCILLDTSDSTLRKRKYRLKNKKMALPEEYSTLDDFVQSFAPQGSQGSQTV